MGRCEIVCRKYRQLKTPNKHHLSPSQEETDMDSLSYFLIHSMLNQLCPKHLHIVIQCVYFQLHVLILVQKQIYFNLQLFIYTLVQKSSMCCIKRWFIILKEQEYLNSSQEARLCSASPRPSSHWLQNLCSVACVFKTLATCWLFMMHTLLYLFSIPFSFSWIHS